MGDLIERLRRAAKHEDGWAIMADAADEIEQLREKWADAETRCALLNRRTRELDELQARIEGAPVVTMKQLGRGIRPSDYGVPWDWNQAGKRVALVVLEDGK